MCVAACLSACCSSCIAHDCEKSWDTATHCMHFFGVAVCCSVLQRVAACCSVLQRVAVRVSHMMVRSHEILQRTALFLFLFTFWYGVATISRLLKIIGLFGRHSLFYRALLQKRPILLRSLLIIATPPHMQITMLAVDNVGGTEFFADIVSFIGLFCKRDLYF